MKKDWNRWKTKAQLEGTEEEDEKGSKPKRKSQGNWKTKVTDEASKEEKYNKIMDRMQRDLKSKMPETGKGDVTTLPFIL